MYLRIQIQFGLQTCPITSVYVQGSASIGTSITSKESGRNNTFKYDSSLFSYPCLSEPSLEKLASLKLLQISRQLTGGAGQRSEVSQIHSEKDFQVTYLAMHRIIRFVNAVNMELIY